MKAIVSSTYDDKYFFFLPIITWCWNKLGVDVVCFVPYQNIADLYGGKTDPIFSLIDKINLNFEFFEAPEHKQATYAQCSRLYAAALDLPEDEILITSDIDMALFSIPPYVQDITILGHDLVPEGQYPMCYASGTVGEWRSAMKINGRSVQQCLDDLLGDIECESFKGNYWAKDQETLFENTCDITTLIPRARPGTQFANNRVDRDDAFWRERITPYLIDAHLWRPGYTDENFSNILELFTIMYPTEDFSWMVEYQQKYKELI